jgi:hypothetical protein
LEEWNMRDEKRSAEELLDRAVETLRRDRIAPERADEIAGRVRRNIARAAEDGGPIRGCEGFRTLIPLHLAGTLSEARKLLFEDHVRECVSCRKALVAARTGRIARPAVGRAATRPAWLKWSGIAAGVLLVGFLFQFALRNDLLPGFGGAAVHVDNARGEVFLVDGGAAIPLAEGSALEARRVVRTGKDSGAFLRLEDGSRVELAERTELAVLPGRRGTTLRLGRGSIIVEAADQGDGRLFVATQDCRVTVKGTVFSVSYGMKGSRVSVIEGTVWVEKSGETTVLTAGRQYVSQPRLTRVALEGEYAWSRNAGRHLTMVEELSLLRRELQEATFGEHLRYSSDLPGYLPEATLLYAAFPNLSGRLDEVFHSFRRRMTENPGIREWMEQGAASGLDLAELDEIVARLRGLGDLLSEEIVLALAAADGGSKPAPLLLAETRDPARFRALLLEELGRLGSDSADGPRIDVVDGPILAQSRDDRLTVTIQGNLVAASPSTELLEYVAAVSTPGTMGSFVGTRFYESVAAAYGSGVDWLLAVDLECVMNGGVLAAAEEGRGGAALQALGVDRIRDLVVERKQNLGVPENRAVLTYEGEPRGLVSWVASPGSMGGLDFVSQDAHLAAAFVVGDPAQLVDDVLEFLHDRQPEAWQAILGFEAEHGFSLRRDIAEPLGGEVVFALDGPMLPTPSWKLILEVYRPEVLQNTIQWAVAEVNRLAAERGEPGLSLTAFQSGGATLHQVRADKTGTSVYYRYVDGYLILAPDSTLILQATQYRAAGYTLPGSPRFLALLPQGGSVSMSGLFYHNLAPLLDPLLSSRLAASLADAVGDEARELESLLRDAPPVLVSLYSEPGRITVAGTADLESIWANLGVLSAVGGPDGISRLLREAPMQ